MADRSAIEWTDATWNPIRARYFELAPDGSDVKERIGHHCEHVSEGCRNCYAERQNLRLGTGWPYKPAHLRPGGDVEVFLDTAALLQPLRWRRPRTVFVGSMTDVFADFVPLRMLYGIFAVMALAPRHTFQVLTKRPRRMRAVLTDTSVQYHLSHAIHEVFVEAGRGDIDILDWGFKLKRWPLPNVWLGTSCETQATADERVPDLLATPAAVRFVSAEPLLGPIDLTCLRCPNGCRPPEYCNRCYPDGHAATGTFDALGDGALSWIIVGGESGPHARPMHPDWARGLRDQCAAAGIPFFFKQWGEWADCEAYPSEIQEHYDVQGRTADGVIRVGKRRAGRLLDDVEHNAMPEARA